MKTVYTFQLYEEEIRSDGFYEADNMDDVFRIIKTFTKGASHPARVVFRKHEIEHACDVCGAGSIKEEITLLIEKTKDF